MSNLINRRLKAISQIDVLPHLGQMLGAMDIRCPVRDDVEILHRPLEEGSPHGIERGAVGIVGINHRVYDWILRRIERVKQQEDVLGILGHANEVMT